MARTDAGLFLIAESIRKEREMIAPCECRNEWQDKQYGNGQRVQNERKETGLGPNQVAVRCTVCKKERVVKLS